MVGMNISSRARWVLLALACVTGPQAAISQTTTPPPAAPPVTPSAAPQQPAGTTPAATAPQSASPAQAGSTAAPQSATPTLQPRADQDPQDGTTFTLHRGVNEVDLIFTVMGKDGHFVSNLQQQNFGLLDDGKPPEAVLRFTQQTNLPLRVGVMLDTSSSIRQRFEFE